MVYQFPNAMTTGLRVPPGPGGVITPGASADLPTYSGPNPITVNGTIVSGHQINSQLTINANNVTIQDCYFPINGQNVLGICISNNGTGNTIDHCEMNGCSSPGVGNGASPIYAGGSGLTISNCNVYGYAKSVYVTSPCTITNNFFWLVGYQTAEHEEQIYINGEGTSNGINITNNSMSSNPNTGEEAGPIFLASQNGPTSNVLVQNNLLVGGGYPLFWDDKTTYARTNCTIEDNNMGGGYYGETSYFASNPTDPSYGTGNVVTGNLDYLSGQSADSSVVTNINITSFTPSNSFTIDNATFAQQIATSDSITLSGCTSAGGHVIQIYQDGVAIQEVSSVSGGTWTSNPLTATTGVHYFVAVDVTGASGNSRSPTYYVQFP